MLRSKQKPEQPQNPQALLQRGLGGRAGEARILFAEREGQPGNVPVLMLCPDKCQQSPQREKLRLVGASQHPNSFPEDPEWANAGPWGTPKAGTLSGRAERQGPVNEAFLGQPHQPVGG